MQQVAVLHFLHDEAIVTRRHANDIHRFVARRIEWEPLRLHFTHADLAQRLFELPKHHADAFGNPRAAGVQILPCGVQGTLKVVKPRQESDHQVRHGILSGLFMLSSRAFAIIIEIRHQPE